MRFKCSVYSPTSGSRRCKEVEEIFENESKPPLWIDLFNSNIKDLEYLMGKGSLWMHPLTVEDILQNDEEGGGLEKCEIFEDYILVSLRVLQQGEVRQSPHIYGKSSQADLFSRIINHRIADQQKSITADWLAYLVLDEVVDELGEEVSLLQAEADVIEDLILSLGRFDQSDMLRRIYAAHRRATILQRLISPKLKIIQTLHHHHQQTKGGGSLTYLRDVQDHIQTQIEIVKNCREMLDRCHEHYLGQSDIELAIAGHAMNVTVGKMTALTFVIGSAMSISAIMGMNVRVPFEAYGLEHDGTWDRLIPFWMLIVGMGATLASVFSYGRFRNWF